ncbi:MAG: hypothetical protein HZB59_11250 [Ignavibacteriales bacterium]|nr:hypothetical protein [Ignavibacteriales bacterium]
MKEFLKILLFISFNVFMIWQSWNCKDEITGDELSKIVFPDSNVSYHAHVEPLFLNACAIPGGCHAGDNPAAGVSLETWLDAREKIGIISPRFPEESRLIWAIEGRDPGVPRMPLDRPPLNANQIKGLKTWIKEGAQNN